VNDTPRTQVEIWSDVVWRSFQLATDTRTDPARNSLQQSLAG
jgi:hypothetical protein